MKGEILARIRQLDNAVTAISDINILIGTMRIFDYQTIKKCNLWKSDYLHSICLKDLLKSKFSIQTAPAKSNFFKTILRSLAALFYIFKTTIHGLQPNYLFMRCNSDMKSRDEKIVTIVVGHNSQL